MASFLRLVPEDDGAGFQGFGQVDEALVVGAAEAQTEIFAGGDERPVDEDVESCEQRVGHAGQLRQILAVDVAGERPDGFFRVGGADLLRERKKAGLIMRVERFAAEVGDAADVVGAEQLQNVVHDGFGKRLAIVKVPRLGVEAVFTVVRAAGNKEADTDAGSICDVPRLNCRIVHR